jgi:hypothetical protein
MTDVPMRGIGRTDTGYLTRLPATNAVAASIPKRRTGFRSASGTRGDGRGELPLP